MGNIEKGKGTFLDAMYVQQMKGAVGPLGENEARFRQPLHFHGRKRRARHRSGGDEPDRQRHDESFATNPDLLKFVTYAILGAAIMAPLGFALSGIAATFGILGAVLGPVAGLLLRLFSPLVSLGPMHLNGLVRIGPWIVRGLMMAFGLLSNPVGWAIILAGVAAALIYYFRDDIARAWPKVVAWFKNAFTSLKTWILSINWSGIGLKIADALTFGLAGRFAAAMAKMKSSVPSAAGMNSGRAWPALERAAAGSAGAAVPGRRVGPGGLHPGCGRHDHRQSSPRGCTRRLARRGRSQFHDQRQWCARSGRRCGPDTRGS